MKFMALKKMRNGAGFILPGDTFSLKEPKPSKVYSLITNGWAKPLETESKSKKGPKFNKRIKDKLEL